MAGKENRKKLWPWVAVAGLVLVAAVALVLVRCSGEPGTAPVLTVETPQKRSASDTGEFTLDVTVSDLGDGIYSAMSMSLRFDASRLEFLGVREGNLFVTDDTSTLGQKLPQWSCNVENSNATGLINIMYLDMTGGKHAFRRDLLAEADNVVLRLSFRLRGSVRPGDVLDLRFEDAVFAASDETQSLAMTTDTLKTQNGKIVIGD